MPTKLHLRPWSLCQATASFYCCYFRLDCACLSHKGWGWPAMVVHNHPLATLYLKHIGGNSPASSAPRS